MPLAAVEGGPRNYAARLATSDEDAKAVVFDINTPGGLAFDTAQLIMYDMRDLEVPSYAFVNREADFLQAAIITSHVAVGSLIFVTALAIAMRVARQLGTGVVCLTMSPSMLVEVAR